MSFSSKSLSSLSLIAVIFVRFAFADLSLELTCSAAASYLVRSKEIRGCPIIIESPSSTEISIIKALIFALSSTFFAGSILPEPVTL